MHGLMGTFRDEWIDGYSRVVTGEKNSPTVAHACRKRRLKWVLGAWEYNWATQSPGDINMETRLGVGRRADDPTPEKTTVIKPLLEMAGRSPLTRRRSALDCRAI
jgi:hypothetical protein